ncbi:MAG: glycerophosphodiester phosphodiesterase [Myxococcaceae bacterium]
MYSPFFYGLRPTLHISHRGGAALAPENTRVAFDAAVERWRTDVLELDVHLTRDGELVVSHDATVERCTNGTGRISEATLGELQRLDAGYRFTPDAGKTFPFRGQGVRMPSLHEVLRAYPGLPLNLELKEDTPGAAEALAREVRAMGAGPRVCLGSELQGLSQKLVALLPEVAHFYPREALSQAVLALKSGEPVAEDTPYGVLDMPYRFGDVVLVDAAFLAAASVAEKWVNVWTVDAEEDMRTLVALGVGGIMTDRPDLLRGVLGQPATGEPC